MAKAEGNLELLSFRRTFALLIMLVVVPSAGLSGFGVLAIINERAAVEKKVEAFWAGQLVDVAEQLSQQLQAAVVVQKDPLQVVSAGGTLLTDVTFTVKDGQIETSEPKLKAMLASVLGELHNLPTRPIFFSVAAPQGSVLVVALRTEATVVGARVSSEALEHVLTASALKGKDEARFHLRAIRREAPEGVFGRLAEVREAALGARELASIALPVPLQDYRLAAVALGEDPVNAASTRNRVLYAVLLGLFYLTLIIGVVYTGRALYREAKLSRLKTDFVSLISHELRTPLTSIRLFIETLALGRVQSKADTQAVLDMLSQETARLSGMIESVLDFARIESGTRRYDKKPTPVAQVIETAITAFKTQRVHAAMKLDVALEEPLPLIDADRDALAGALLNLLNNAFKYSGDDKQIAVRARAERAGVAIEVRDNGVGIPKSEQRRIFERFYRVDNLLSRATEGSGLGLSISQRIVQGHGGKISVSSEVGSGSTFTVHLPAAKASES